MYVDFYPKFFLILYTSLENSTIGIAILIGFDLGNRARFPVFANAISGIKKQLKQDGRHKTNHYEEIPSDTLEVIVKIRLKSIHF